LTCLRCILVLALWQALGGIAVLAQSQAAPAKVTLADLRKLSAAGVQDEVIIRLIQASDELPSPSAQDLIELQKAGVSQNVITALLQRRTALIGRPHEEIGRRRIQVSATLLQQRRALWNRRLGEEIKETQISWGLRATGWREGARLEPLPTSTCPHDNRCVRWNEASGTCEERLEADSEAWRRQYACYVADRVIGFGARQEIFDVYLPEPASHAEVTIDYRGVDGSLNPWYSRNAGDAAGKRLPGYLKIQFWGSRDIDLQVHLDLYLSPGGYVQDLRVDACEVVNRDDEAMQRRVLSDTRQYCRIEEVRLPPGS
jgi:hypothetical protein